MNKIINQTPNGKIFRCLGCNKIHIEYKNLSFSFDDQEYTNFSKYFIELDGDYWERKNSHIQFHRKIIIPVGHKNLKIHFNIDELNELKHLFSRSVTPQLHLLSHFNYDISNN